MELELFFLGMFLIGALVSIPASMVRRSSRRAQFAGRRAQWRLAGERLGLAFREAHDGSPALSGRLASFALELQIVGDEEVGYRTRLALESGGVWPEKLTISLGSTR